MRQLNKVAILAQPGEMLLSAADPLRGQKDIGQDHVTAGFRLDESARAIRVCRRHLDVDMDITSRIAPRRVTHFRRILVSRKHTVHGFSSTPEPWHSFLHSPHESLNSHGQLRPTSVFLSSRGSVLSGNQQLDNHTQKVAQALVRDLLGISSAEQALHGMSDFISGMTDRYALRISRMLSGT
jgi:hypothetical protein